MGGGGGGGGPYYNVRPQELQNRVKEANEEIARNFSPKLQDYLNHKLSEFTHLNSEAVGEHQEEVERALEPLFEHRWNLRHDLRQGGSVAKHTYVDGISDVDTLVVLRDLNTKNYSPQQIKHILAKQLEKEIEGASIRVGNIAVTIAYKDGLEVQVIPAVRDGNRLHVPSWSGDGWSKINPRTFVDALSRRNAENNAKVVPVIKLAKSIISSWPIAVRLSGYHVESLAIDAFRKYQGEKTTVAMLPHLFERAATTVLTPMKDSTGQSVHVDSYLGRTRSEERQKAAHWCSQVAKRMRNATTQGSLSQWKELFE
jgi:hypothetical protein